ncbi:hypothetical protein [Undibacterium sp. Xuan67W]|uniref:hypothetical protein n=1 Tax=Undibacterium sp. Xuan67W TaxID=3413057 RepID=UPI003BF1F3C0
MNQLTSFDQAEKIVDRFRDLLHRYNINPPVHSVIENELLAPYEVLLRSKSPSSIAERSNLLAEAAGMFDLAAKLLSIETHPEFATFVPHLTLFGSAHPLASTIQTTPGQPTDDVHRKLAELYLGSLAVNVGHNVELDHPSNSRGDNPDVLFDFIREAGEKKRWALAIKTISTRNGQTIFERIGEAGRQINTLSCPADRGLVVVNAQGSIDHQALWGKTFTNVTEAKTELSNQIGELWDSANANRCPSDWTDILKDRVSPVVLFMGHAYVRVSTPFSQNTPTLLKVLMSWNPTKTNDDEAASICVGLNHFMHLIQEGIPGTANSFPK